MKIDRTKLKKSASEVPAECKLLIERIKACGSSKRAELLAELKLVKTWTYGKCELFHWADVLDIFDEILEESCKKEKPEQWTLPCDLPANDLLEILLRVLSFTALLIEHSFTRHLYSSMEHLTTLLSASDMTVVLAVLNLLYVFSKRSNFITRLPADKKQGLVVRLTHLAESWGGKENGFGLAECCQDLPKSSYPGSATTLHFEYYAEQKEEASMKKNSGGTGLSVLSSIHIENLDVVPKLAATVMEELMAFHSVPNKQQMLLFTHIRLAQAFSSYEKRLQCVQARLQAISVLVYSNAMQENVNTLLYSGLIEELVDVLEVKEDKLMDIKATALRTLTSIIHLDRNPKLNNIIDATGAASYHGFLPLLVRSCIQHMTDSSLEAFPQPFATALFSFLYHLASYENGGEALVSCGMMESLLKVINWFAEGQEHITFVTRAVRVVDLITNLDMQAFQSHGGLTAFINRLQHEVEVCRREQPFVIRPQRSESIMSIDSQQPLSPSDTQAPMDTDQPTASSADVTLGEQQPSGGVTVGEQQASGGVTVSEQQASGGVTFSELLASGGVMIGEQQASGGVMVGEQQASGGVMVGEQQASGGVMVSEQQASGGVMVSEQQASGGASSTNERNAPSTSSVERAVAGTSGVTDNNTGPRKGVQCFPQRAALLKSMLNFLKKAIPDPAFSDSIRHLMDGSLPRSLKHVISNAEYYGPSLFLLATDVVTVYVFQEPSLLSSLQDNGLTDVVLHALLVKDVPATREVLASLPNVFSALCLNTRGLEAFVACKPFDRLFKVLLSPDYLPAMRRRRSSDPPGDTASSLGSAMDELMRHQPSLRTEATKAIIKLLKEVCAMGKDDKYICQKPQPKSSDQPASTSLASVVRGRSNVGMNANDEAASSDDDEEEDEMPTMDAAKPTPPEEAPQTQPTETASSSSTEKQERVAIPLMDYVLNVMKFVEAILSNNTTDDHCREFVTQGGLEPLMGILGLPNLPVDFPASPSCQAVAAVAKSVLTLSHEAKILEEGLVQLNTVLGSLEPLHRFLEPPGGSVLLRELAGALRSVTGAEDPLLVAHMTPLLHSLSAAHAYISTFTHMCKGGQSDIRSLCVNQWGSDLGLKVLKGLSRLYTSLVWESTVLLAFCSEDILPSGSQFGKEDLDKLIPAEEKAKLEESSGELTRASGELGSNGVSQAMQSLTTTDSALSPMDTTEPDVVKPASDDASKSSSGSKTDKDSDKKSSKMPALLQAQIKQIKPLLSASSRLGRALAELFGLLVKLSVGSPVRQRRMQIPHNPTPPSQQARSVAKALTNLLMEGLSWLPPPSSPVPKLRLTFFICSVSFTSPMLFDEKKNPYHLMLHHFVSSGGQNALFDAFQWALSCSGKVPVSEGLEYAELPDGTGEFLDAWLMLVEKMVNPKLVLDSPHALPKTTPTGSQVPPNFNPLQYLILTHKLAFKAVMQLWNRKPLKVYGARMSESMLAILCHIIQGEPIIKERLKKENEEQAARSSTPVSTAAAAAAAAASTASSSAPPPISIASLRQELALGNSSLLSRMPPPREEPQVNQEHLQQLMDMGFSREHGIDALNHTSNLEQATEYILTHPPPLPGASSSNSSGGPALNMHVLGLDSEEDQMRRAIAMSLGEDMAAQESSEDKDVEKSEEEDKEVALSLSLAPLTSEEVDDFTAGLLGGCLRLLDNLPESVYRVCDLIVVVANRNGDKWREEILNSIVAEVAEPAMRLLEASGPMQSGDPRSLSEWASQLTNMKQAPEMASRLHLLTLLFQEMGLATAEVIEETGILTLLVRLLESAQQCLAAAQHSTTPKWMAPLLLLLDLFEKMAVVSKRKSRLEKLVGKNRTWKWFDDRSGKWSAYGASNNKTIDDAYSAGETSIRFTAGRRRYTVQFTTMMQINEETGNRRPIMLSLPPREEKKDDQKADSNSSEVGKTTASDTAAKDTAMETEPSTDTQELHIIEGLGIEQVSGAMRACVGLIGINIDSDTLHACLRLLLRLTRHQHNSVMFAELGGPRLLMALRHDMAFQGFTSLATLILRHVMEDEATLAHTMEKVIRSSTLGTGSSLSGVGQDSVGSKELHYVLRVLAPAAARNPDLFVNMAKKILRISLPPPAKRDDLEANLANPNTPQVMKCVAAKQSSLPTLSLYARDVLTELLNALIHQYTPVQETAVSGGQAKPAQTLAEAIEDVVNEVAREIIERQQQTAVTTSDNSMPGSNEDSDASGNKGSIENKTDTEKSERRPVLFKSAILRLLAEMVRSYGGCATMVTQHSYHAGQTALVSQDCGALAFILDHLLPQCQKDGDKDCPALSRVLLASLAACNHSPEAQTALVSEVKSSLQRALIMQESTEKHARIQAIVSIVNTIIEACPTPGQLPTQVFKGQHTTTMNNIVKLLLKKSLVSDLARVPHSLDLSSPHMATTVNMALKPLETLSRIVNQPQTVNNKNNKRGVWGNASSSQETVTGDPIMEAVAAGVFGNAGSGTTGNTDSVPTTRSRRRAQLASSRAAAAGGEDTQDEEPTEEDDDDDDDDEATEEEEGEGDVRIEDVTGNEAAIEDIEETGPASAVEPHDELDEVLGGLFDRHTDAESQVLGEIIMNAAGASPSSQGLVTADADDGQEVISVGVEFVHDDDDDVMDHHDSQMITQEISDGDDDEDTATDRDVEEEERDEEEDEEEEDGCEDECEDVIEECDEDEDDDDDDDDDDDEGSDMQSEDDLADMDDENMCALETDDDDLLVTLEEVLPLGSSLICDENSSFRSYQLPIASHEGDLANDVSGTGLPPAPSNVPASHPLLIRHSEAAQALGASAGSSSAAARVHRGAGGRQRGTYRYNPSTQTLHVHYNAAANALRHGNPPAILQRLLGPGAGEILQLTTSGPGGQARFHFMTGEENRFRHDDDLIDDAFHESVLEGDTSGSGALSSVPAALTRWSEESRVLDGDSMHDCVTVLKPAIMKELEKIRDEELAERKEKRKKAAEEEKASLDQQKEAKKNEEGDEKEEKASEERNETEREEMEEETATVQQPQADSSMETVESAPTTSTLYSIGTMDSSVDTSNTTSATVVQDTSAESSMVDLGTRGLSQQEQEAAAQSLAEAIMSAIGESASTSPSVSNQSMAAAVPGFGPELPQVNEAGEPEQSGPSGTELSEIHSMETEAQSISSPAPAEPTAMDLSTSNPLSSLIADTSPISPEPVPPSPFDLLERAGVEGQRVDQGHVEVRSQVVEADHPSDITSSDAVTINSSGSSSENPSMAEASTPGETAPTTFEALTVSTTPSNTTSSSTGATSGIGGDVEVSSASVSATAASSSQGSNTEASSDLPEGVDPSFLAALPENIREEVIAEHTRLQQLQRRARQQQQEAQSLGVSEVSPEFLAALPPSIQEEVLAQQRAEQARLQASQRPTGASEDQATTGREPSVDPGSFIQSLPPALRQQVLADMDDSLVAVLPPELASEAGNLRREFEERHRRLMQERLYSQGAGLLSGILRHSGFSSRPGSSRFGIRTPAIRGAPHWAWGSGNRSQAGTSNSASTVRLRGRHLLDQEALACLLVLLFVDEPKLNTSRLHRVLRNLCYHNQTRTWVVEALLAILKRTSECGPLNSAKPIEGLSNERLIGCESKGKKGKSSSTPVSVSASCTVVESNALATSTPRVPPTTMVASSPNWLSVSLDAALGCRANVFQIQRLSGASTSKRPSTTAGHISIHPQAAPVVCRHVLDTLISLAKSFPSHFLPQNAKAKEVITACDNTPKQSDSKASSKSQETDIWELLVRLDYLAGHSRMKGKLATMKSHSHPMVSESSEVSIATVAESYESCVLGQLMSMLAHPVVRRSQMLTDRLLRLLGLVSSGLPDHVASSTSISSAATTTTTTASISTTQPIAVSVATATTTASAPLSTVVSSSLSVPSSSATSVSIATQSVITTSVLSSHSQTATTVTTATTTTSASSIVSMETSNVPHATPTSQNEPLVLGESLEMATMTIPEEDQSSSAQQLPTTTPTESMTTKPEDSKQERETAVLETQLQLAVEVLTSKSCSEDGLEDATSLLLQLSRANSATRDSILRLLLAGARMLGLTLCQHIRALYDEIQELNLGQEGSPGSSPDEPAPSSSSSAPHKGFIPNRHGAGGVVLHVATKSKSGAASFGRELQLPSMQLLTSKTSSQQFLLRVLKVIIQLRQAAARQAPARTRVNPTTVGRELSNLTEAMAMLEAEADEMMELITYRHLQPGSPPTPPVRPGASSTAESQNNQLNQAIEEAPNHSHPPMEVDNPTAGTSSASSSNTVDTVTVSSSPSMQWRLSEQLDLEELWESLGRCLTALGRTPDTHAVLVLQPAVEAFFIVHAGEKEEKKKPSSSTTSSQSRSAEDHLAHLNADMSAGPLSPAPSSHTVTTDTTSTPSAVPSLLREDSAASVSVSNLNLPPDTQKFLKFAETHRTVLNQILRQSSTPLSEGPFSVLVEHTRVLDFDVKRRYFRQELERLDEGVRREDLAVHVRRSHVFEDSFRDLHRRTPDEWKHRFYIVFEGEEGQDAGGLLREWYIIISREIFNPNYALFCTSTGDQATYSINPASHCNSNHLSYFKFVGRIIAKAIFDNKLLECYFTRSFYKHILGVLVKYTDMESEDYSFYQGLVFLIENEIQHLGYDLTFSTEIQEFGVTEIRDLKPEGRHIAVTEENKKEYVKLVCQMKMTGAIRKQLSAFLDGFYDIIPKRLISIFNEQELELLISGLPTIDIDDLKANTEYHKYQPNSLQIQWFWRALRSFDQAERAQFLQFVTGTSKVPLQGFSHLEGMNGTQKFQIHRDDRSTDRLPCAHTCFNQLDLPAYETYDKLHSQLLTAISECSEGFGLA